MEDNLTITEKVDFEIQTDILTLLENVRCQSSNGSLMKQALNALATICNTNSNCQDYFRATGGIDVLKELLVNGDCPSQALPSALFCLACAVSQNVISQDNLLNEDIFLLLHELFVQNEDNLDIINTSIFLLACSVEGNGKGQRLAHNTDCLKSLIKILKNMIISECIEDNKWANLSRAVCVCVNNPQNVSNQQMCCSILPHILKLIHTKPQHPSIRQVLNIICAVVANNASNKKRLYQCGGVETLINFLKQLVECSDLTQPTSTITTAVAALDACISDNEKACKQAGDLGIITVLLALLYDKECGQNYQHIIVLSIAHVLEYANCCLLVSQGQGFKLLVTYLTETEDEELFKAIKYIFSLCKMQANIAGSIEQRKDDNSHVPSSTSDVVYKGCNNNERSKLVNSSNLDSMSNNIGQIFNKYFNANERSDGAVRNCHQMVKHSQTHEPLQSSDSCFSGHNRRACHPQKTNHKSKMFNAHQDSNKLRGQKFVSVTSPHFSVVRDMKGEQTTPLSCKKCDGIKLLSSTRMSENVDSGQDLIIKDINGREVHCHHNVFRDRLPLDCHCTSLQHQLSHHTEAHYFHVDESSTNILQQGELNSWLNITMNPLNQLVTEAVEKMMTVLYRSLSHSQPTSQPDVPPTAESNLSTNQTVGHRQRSKVSTILSACDHNSDVLVRKAAKHVISTQLRKNTETPFSTCSLSVRPTRNCTDTIKSPNVDDDKDFVKPKLPNIPRYVRKILPNSTLQSSGANKETQSESFISNCPTSLTSSDFDNILMEKAKKQEFVTVLELNPDIQDCTITKLDDDSFSIVMPPIVKANLMKESIICHKDIQVCLKDNNRLCEKDVDAHIYNFISDGSNSEVSKMLGYSEEGKKRRSRVPYTDEEVFNLLTGVSKMGKSWKQILCSYKFHPVRTSVDLKDKYKRLMVEQRAFQESKKLKGNHKK